MTRASLREMSRRAFLVRGARLAIAAGLAAALGGSASGVLGFGRAASPGARLAAALPHGEGAARVGRAALAGGLVERDVAGLVAGLAGAVPDLSGLLRNGTDDDIRAALDVARRYDFAGRGPGLTRIDGWIVARTEARACALIALSRG
jgi:hypothetical protein